MRMYQVTLPLLVAGFSLGLAAPSSAVLIFSDDLSEANGTTLNGKVYDTGSATTKWVQSGSALTITNTTPGTAGSSFVDTTGNGNQTAFATFTRALLLNELLTVTVRNFQPSGNNFFSSLGFAGYSFYTGGSTGTEQIFFGDLNSMPNTWSIQKPTAPAATQSSSNSIADNIATFTYNSVTGVAALSLSNGGPVATLSGIPTGLAIDSLRVANGNGGDVKFGTITADATTIPEPATAALAFVAGCGMLGFLRRRAAVR